MGFGHRVLLGVGGGFLIVPALVMLVGMPMHHAVGTSLVVIAMNSLAGLLGHLSSVTLDLPLIATFIAAGVLGTFAGARLGRRLDPALLRPGRFDRSIYFDLPGRAGRLRRRVLRSSVSAPSFSLLTNICICSASSSARASR